MPKRKERLLWLLLIGIGAFNKVDYMMTLHFLQRGFREANPFLAPHVDTLFFPLLKLLIVPILLIVLWNLRHRYEKHLVSFVWVPFISYSTLMVYFRLLLMR